MMANAKDHPAAVPQQPAQGVRTISVRADQIESRDLFSGTREVTIAHGGHLYRLRLTSQDKLLLTK
jgi:hemin uptake protein HemP